MYRKRLAALIMTGCLFSGLGCSMFGSSAPSTSGGLFSGGCCGHTSSSGGGLFSRMRGSGSAPVAAMPVTGGAYAGGSSMGGYGGVDCPCSHQGGNEGMFHPAILSQGGGMSSGQVMGDMVPSQGIPVQTMPAQGYPNQQFQGQPGGQMTYPGVPPNTQPMVPNPNPAPRIQPIPQAPMGMAPTSGMGAVPSTWNPPAH